MARRRAEEAAVMRRMSRRSFAVPRQNNSERDGMNSTQRNTSAENEVLEQRPTTQGDEIPAPVVVSVHSYILNLCFMD